MQPGSNAQVLRNTPGITDPTQMDEAELSLLLQLYEWLMGDQFPERRLDVADLMEWHRLWLGNLYDWAGQVRSVNLAKGEFHFAAAAQIPRLLAEFERDCLHLRELVSVALAAQDA
ncbi:MAG: Fic family protein [Gammaproteobacteria bacterium]|nr:Fic family protein [Gammaproteobacteria bacterium]